MTFGQFRNYCDAAVAHVGAAGMATVLQADRTRRGVRLYNRMMGRHANLRWCGPQTTGRPVCTTTTNRRGQTTHIDKESHAEGLDLFEHVLAHPLREAMGLELLLES